MTAIKALHLILVTMIIISFSWFRQRNRKYAKSFGTIFREQFFHLLSFVFLFMTFSELHDLEKIAKSGTLPIDFIAKLTETIKWFTFASLICFASIYDKQMKLLKEQTADMEKRIKKLEGSPYIP